MVRIYFSTDGQTGVKLIDDSTYFTSIKHFFDLLMNGYCSYMINNKKNEVVRVDSLICDTSSRRIWEKLIAHQYSSNGRRHKN